MFSALGASSMVDPLLELGRPPPAPPRDFFCGEAPAAPMAPGVGGTDVPAALKPRPEGIGCDGSNGTKVTINSTRILSAIRSQLDRSRNFSVDVMSEIWRTGRIGPDPDSLELCSPPAPAPPALRGRFPSELSGRLLFLPPRERASLLLLDEACRREEFIALGVVDEEGGCGGVDAATAAMAASSCALNSSSFTSSLPEARWSRARARRRRKEARRKSSSVHRYPPYTPASGEEGE